MIHSLQPLDASVKALACVSVRSSGKSISSSGKQNHHELWDEGCTIEIRPSTIRGRAEEAEVCKGEETEDSPASPYKSGTSSWQGGVAGRKVYRWLLPYLPSV